jgi:hypothetical protein
LKLATLEKNLEDTKTKEKILAEELEKEQGLLVDAEEKFNQLKSSLSLWTGRLTDIAERLTVQLAAMGMKSWGFSVNKNEAKSDRLMMFFEGLIDALKAHHQESATLLANESRKLACDMLFKVLVKLVHRNPGIDISKAFMSLPKGTDTSAVEALVAPIANSVGQVSRTQGGLTN